MSSFIKNIFLVLHYLILAILYTTSLLSEVGTRHSHQILLNAIPWLSSYKIMFKRSMLSKTTCFEWPLISMFPWYRFHYIVPGKMLLILKHCPGCLQNKFSYWRVQPVYMATDGVLLLTGRPWRTATYIPCCQPARGRKFRWPTSMTRSTSMPSS